MKDLKAPHLNSLLGKLALDEDWICCDYLPKGCHPIRLPAYDGHVATRPWPGLGSLPGFAPRAPYPAPAKTPIPGFHIRPGPVEEKFPVIPGDEILPAIDCVLPTNYPPLALPVTPYPEDEQEELAC